MQRLPNYDETMICFNEKGNAKIWINYHLALNKPKNSPMIKGNVLEEIEPT